MAPADPFAVSPDRPFAVGEFDDAFCEGRTRKINGCAAILCHSGRAVWNVDQRRFETGAGSLLLLLPHMRFSLCECSGDFRAVCCAFARDLFSEASYRLEPDFFEFIYRTPVFSLSKRSAEGAAIWFRMMEYTCRDRGNMFRNIIIRNRLQNFLLEVYDKMLRSGEERLNEATTRQNEIFHRFIALVSKHCTREREVAFYADRLCISTRYLSGVVRNVSRESAKEIIDRITILEVKMLLRSTDLSIQEIAYRLHFPDQSYLGRYFKRHTGESPSGYRSVKR